MLCWMWWCSIFARRFPISWRRCLRRPLVCEKSLFSPGEGEQVVIFARMKDWKGVRRERQGSAERGACIGAALMRGREKEKGRAGKRRTLCCVGLNHRFSANFSYNQLLLFPLGPGRILSEDHMVGRRINLHVPSVLCYTFYFRPSFV